MPREFLSDADVEKEIERLSASPLVYLARQEHRIKMRRRQYLYKLRWMEKRGKQLEAQGVTIETLHMIDEAMEIDESATAE